MQPNAGGQPTSKAIEWSNKLEGSWLSRQGNG